MTNYISELALSLNDQEQHLRERGFQVFQKDLNKGTGRKEIYLWYKKGPKPITRVQFSFYADMIPGLTNAGYTKIDIDLNPGSGDPIYLWYYQGSGEYDTPIVDVDFTIEPENEAAKFRLGWERLALNLKVLGYCVHLWVKREPQTYICDITATDSYESDTELLKSGYMRLGENTNRGAGGSFVFIWYRQTTDPKRALTDLQVSTSNEEVNAFQLQAFTSVGVNLNDKTGGHPVYLWSKKRGPKNPIKVLALLLNKAWINNYSEAGLIVIVKNLNEGNDGKAEYLCVYQ